MDARRARGSSMGLGWCGQGVVEVRKIRALAWVWWEQRVRPQREALGGSTRRYGAQDGVRWRQGPSSQPMQCHPETTQRMSVIGEDHRRPGPEERQRQTIQRRRLCRETRTPQRGKGLSQMGVAVPRSREWLPAPQGTRSVGPTRTHLLVLITFLIFCIL